MQVLYKSTRGKEETVTASMAILKGLSEDGGLFVPTEIPKLDVPMDELAKMSYQETAYEVMKCFLTDFTEEELKNCINNAYDEKFVSFYDFGRNAALKRLDQKQIRHPEWYSFCHSTYHLH